MASPVENLTGGLLITIFLAVLLYGITTTQAYVYWFNYPNDPNVLRRTVIALWLLETLHTAFCFHLTYNYTILDFGNVSEVITIVWSAGATVITAVIIAALVQSSFIRRIWILSQRSIWITSVPAVLLFIRVALGAAIAILTWVTDTWIEFRDADRTFFTLIIALSFAASVDLVIALILIYYLTRSRTGYHLTDHLIKTLMAYVINTGALTMVVSITIVITFVVYKESLLFTGFVEIQSKLYANSFLAALNARKYINGFGRGGRRTGSPNMDLSFWRPPLSEDPKTSHTIEIYQQTSKISDLGERTRGSVAPYAPGECSAISEDLDGTSEDQVIEPFF